MSSVNILRPNLPFSDTSVYEHQSLFLSTSSPPPKLREFRVFPNTIDCSSLSWPLRPDAMAATPIGGELQSSLLHSLVNPFLPLLTSAQDSTPRIR